ncbi:uncharacterized protein LOC124953918 [Vespa velutina]|uniref:uncharacterized protein LOC124953918 n=1 Tax=Vespa velutina TaxID=202808 RepID=UPI001FB3206E|nr:uncharacterized protein LOC124953918 [Vespa velutina]
MMKSLEECAHITNRNITKDRIISSGRATRPENLDITPWYHENFSIPNSSSEYMIHRKFDSSSSHVTKELKLKLISKKDSSVETETPQIEAIGITPRKAYMDLVDAIALLDETCPNQEFNPSDTIKITEASLLPYTECKKVKSKNKSRSSYNHDHDRLNQRSFKRHRPQDKNKNRPLMKKIGKSKTEEMPFLIRSSPNLGTIRKPCFQKIRSRKVLEQPTLNKISSLKKFIFDTTNVTENFVVNFKSISETTTADIQTSIEQTNNQQEKQLKKSRTIELPIRRYSDIGQSSSVTIHSFETDDLDKVFSRKTPLRDYRRASLDNVIDTGSCSSLVKDVITNNSKLSMQQRFNSIDTLIKHKINVNERSVSSSKYIGSSFTELDRWSSFFKKQEEIKKCMTHSTIDCICTSLKIGGSTPNLKECISNSLLINTSSNVKEQRQKIITLNKLKEISHVKDKKIVRNTTSKCQKWQIFFEPLQDTLDMFNELRKVSSLLNIPSWEKFSNVDKTFVQIPKQIFLNKKETLRHESSRQYIASERSEPSTNSQNERKEQLSKLIESVQCKKTYLPLHHVLKEKQEIDSKAISLTTAKDLTSQTEVDSKFYLSDIFNVPLQKRNVQEQKEMDMKIKQATKAKHNHCLEIKVANPMFQKESSSQKMVQIQGRTNDFYEIVSSKTVPNCAEKQLSKVSAEEDTKLENFTLGSKVDYQSVIEQKRTKCFPL